MNIPTTIATHNGSFHADDVFGVAVLRLLHPGATLLRTRDAALIAAADYAVDVGGEWCAWCHILDRFIASHAEVQKLLDAHYVWVKVNYSPQNPNEPLLSRWPRVKGYPHLFVLDAQGRLLATQASGELESGKDYDAGRVLAFLRRHQPAR